jgi:hypothetical protein
MASYSARETTNSVKASLLHASLLAATGSILSGILIDAVLERPQAVPEAKACPSALTGERIETEVSRSAYIDS